MQAHSLAVDAVGTLLIDGVWRPIAVRAQRVSGGDLDIETRRPEAGSIVEHEISGWNVRDLTIDLLIYNPVGDEEQAWGHLAVLREAQFRHDSQLPAVWSLSGRMADALDLRHVIIIAVDDIETNNDRDGITCRLKLRETDPTIGLAQAQAVVTPADPVADTAADTEPLITPEESRNLDDAIYGGE